MIYDLNSIRGEDRLDSRDLIETWRSLVGGDELNPDPETIAELDDEDRELMAAIAGLADTGIEDWDYGAQFIREDTFEDYARELADDIGAIDRNANWPLTHIDWPAAASELTQDYTSVTFLGHDYYVR